MDIALRAMLVCPVDHAPLQDEPEVLVCTRCQRRYPIIDCIPNMVALESVKSEE